MLKINYIIDIFFFTVCFSALCISIFGRFIGRFGGIFLVVFFQLILFCISIYLYVDILKGKFYYVSYGSWVLLGLGFNWSFIFDVLSIEMSLVICIISTLVILFACEYMETDPHFLRFLSYLVFFALFMLFYVLSGNLLQIFLGWEGVGLVSFLLVNFWCTRLEANRSAIKAILFNRVGDISFIFFLVFFVFFFKSLEVPFLLQCLVYSSEHVLVFNIFNCIFALKLINLIVFFIFIAAAGKSAQIGFHAWLPDAMEGPTPVSALLHSATMVTAGVFLVLRFSSLFNSSDFLPFVALVGSFTAFISAIFASFQYDLKKIIAFSTCSQLGFMITSIGFGNFFGGFYHLCNHAFFKALLFLVAGSIIHSLSDEQDVRKMGGLLTYLPFTYLCSFIGSLGLVGFPFFSGFYSKEVIIFISLRSCFSFLYTISFCLIFFSSVLTIYYSYKILYRVFLQNFFRGFRLRLYFVHEPGFYMTFSMFIFSVLSVFFGFFMEDFFSGPGVNLSSIWYYFSGVTFPFFFLEKDLVNLFFKFFFLSLSFYVFSKIFSFFYLQYNSFFKLIFKNDITDLYFFKLMFFFYSSYFGFGSFVYSLTNFCVLKFYYYFFVLLDRGILDKFGPIGISGFLWGFSSFMSFFSRFLSIRNFLYLFFFMLFFFIVFLLNLSLFLTFNFLLVMYCFFNLDFYLSTK